MIWGKETTKLEHLLQKVAGETKKFLHLAREFFSLRRRRRLHALNVDFLVQKLANEIYSIT
jgi:hypothetical protein